MDVRRDREVSRQAGNAAEAAAIADSTVAFDPRATWPLTAPVAGFVISPRRVSVSAVTACPLIQWESGAMKSPSASSKCRSCPSSVRGTDPGSVRMSE